MTARDTTVDPAAIGAAIEHLERTLGHAPSVLALARHLGMANTTFRRRYPDVVAQLRNPPQLANTVGATASAAAESDLVKLRQRNRDLADDLALAVSNIQRLSIDNRALRRQLEEITAVTHLPRRP